MWGVGPPKCGPCAPNLDNVQSFSIWHHWENPNRLSGPPIWAMKTLLTCCYLFVLSSTSSLLGQHNHCTPTDFRIQCNLDGRCDFNNGEFFLLIFQDGQSIWHIKKWTNKIEYITKLFPCSTCYNTRLFKRSNFLTHYTHHRNSKSKAKPSEITNRYKQEN